ncbi:MAG: AI-2E family transporter [Bryobacteraceae bacterium]
MAILSQALPTEKAFHRGITVIAAAAVVVLLYYGRPFFVTVTLSAMLAFLLDPIVLLVMRLRLPRPAATSVVIGVALLLAYLLGVVIWTQVSGLAQDLPTYTSRVSELLDKTSAKLDDIENHAVEAVIPQRLREQEQEIQQKPQKAAQARKRKTTAQVAPPPQPPQVQEVRIKQEPRPAISLIYGYISDYARAILMTSFVPFLTYFMLSWRDHMRKGIINMFRGEQRYVAGKSLDSVAASTRSYLLGNVVLGVFLSCASGGAFFLFKVPYWPLIGLLSGFLSLLPYVGLPLAMLPPVLAAMAIPNKFTVILSLAAIAGGLHLVAMNLAYPKVVGRHVHVNPLALTIALMFWTLMWGGIGLILAVPITAAIKAVCENVESLQPVARLLAD